MIKIPNYTYINTEVNESLNFIVASIYKIFETLKNKEDIIILIPEWYKNHFDRFQIELDFRRSNYEPMKEFYIMDIKTNFISPTDDIYVFHKNYSCINREVWFKRDLSGLKKVG